MANETVEYKTASGRVFYVGQGIGGDKWMVLERKPNGNSRRVVSKELPLCDSRELAEQLFRNWVANRVYLFDRPTRDEFRPIYETWHGRR